MGLVGNRYGLSARYGHEFYKGYANDAPNSLKGISYSDYKKCFHHGFDAQQGYGWDEVTGAAWVWPESQGCVQNVFDGSGQMLLVVWDEASGLPYVINTKDAPTNANMERVYKDKVDPLTAGSGTDIAGTVKLPEHFGENKHYAVEHSETNIHVRPSKAANRDATGYDTNGLLTGFEFDANIYVDGSLVATAAIEDISTEAENVFDRKASGATNQIEIVSNKSDFRLMATESYYTVEDGAKRPAIGRTTEDTYHLAFATPTVWLSRGSRLLLNRASGVLLTGTANGLTGADNRSNSGMTISATVTATNAAIANGSILLWSKASGYAVSGSSLTALQIGSTDAPAVNGWYLYYKTGALGAALTFPAGTVFDARVYDTILTGDQIQDYYYDVKDNQGRNYLPVF